MSYSKVHDGGSYRLYKFDKPLSKGIKTGLLSNPEVNFICEWDDSNKLCDMKPREAEYFIVSDSSTHIERIVFPMWFLEGYGVDDLGKGTPCIFKGVACHGVYTMSIWGGDSSTIRPDEEYLDELWELNKEDKISG